VRKNVVVVTLFDRALKFYFVMDDVNKYLVTMTSINRLCSVDFECTFVSHAYLINFTKFSEP
jgi:hypothetical protein